MAIDPNLEQVKLDDGVAALKRVVATWRVDFIQVGPHVTDDQYIQAAMAVITASDARVAATVAAVEPAAAKP